MPIAIVDCGSSNLRSVLKAFQKFDPAAFVTTDKTALLGATGIVLPGVGAFDAGINYLRAKGLEETILQLIAVNRPFLGICLGLQLLFERSEEGQEKGLAAIQGTVKRFNFTGVMKNLKVPHMGWNRVLLPRPNPLFEGIEEGTQFYFVHSYYAQPKNQEEIASFTDYGINFASSIRKGNLFATQFHPEKSGEQGLKVIANFVRLCKVK